MVATAVQKKKHDKFVERFLVKGLESFGVTGEMVLQTDTETGPIDVEKHVAAEREATTIIRQTPNKSSQSNAYVERTHQSVEAMVRTMKEVIQDKAHARLSATDKHHEFDTQHSCKHVSLLEKTAKNHSRDDITKITRANFCHSEKLLMRKSETRKPNAAKSTPDSFQAFGLEEPQRAVGTSSNSTGCLHSKVGSSEEHQECERHRGHSGRGQSSGSSNAREAA